MNSETQRAVNALNDAQVQITVGQQRVEAAHAAIIDTILTLRAQAESSYDVSLVALLRHLYWHQPSIAARSLSKAAGFDSHQAMLNVIGSCPSGVPCAGCGKDLPKTSRSWKAPWNKHCSDCVPAKNEEEIRVRTVMDLRAHVIGRTRVYMPCRDWRAAAALVVAYPPLGLGVQRGSDDDERNGFWLAWENAHAMQEDLLSKGYEVNASVGFRVRSARKLVRAAQEAAGWDIGRTVSLTSEFTDEPAHTLLARLHRQIEEAVATARGKAGHLFPDGHEPTLDDRAWMSTENHSWWEWSRG